jgi:pyruvate formate lyase activating enzyme
MNVRIGAVIKTSLIDFPGKISSVVFFQGCNFRCGYCYNIDVVIPDRFSQPLPVEDFFTFLGTRKGLIDGVVLLGGEPLIQPGIMDFAKKVKAEGFAVKLDTNGSRISVMKEMISKKLVDFVSMDVKAPLDYSSYYKVCGCSEADFQNVLESIALLKKGKVDYEFRTTLAPNLVGFDSVREIAGQLKGAKKYVIQNFFAGAPSYIDLRFSDIRPYYQGEVEALADEIRQTEVFEKVAFR